MTRRQMIVARIRAKAASARAAREEATDLDPEVTLSVRPRDYRSDRSGPCDDDRESTAPYVGMLPEESDGEGPSPLRFG